jgi:hypothetical protein
MTDREACNNLWEAQRLTDSQISDHIKAAIAAEREACIKLIESYTIPVGNSAAGEMACEWTWDALKVIRNAIRARGKE